MGRWRELFEAGRPTVAEPENRSEYTFGPPATADQIAAAEATLRVRFPDDVRELLSEFNGVWSGKTSDDIHLLDLRHMTIDVPEYCADSGNPMPPEEDLRKVVWVGQSNGFGELYGVRGGRGRAPGRGGRPHGPRSRRTGGVPAEFGGVRPPRLRRRPGTGIGRGTTGRERE